MVTKICSLVCTKYARCLSHNDKQQQQQMKTRQRANVQVMLRRCVPQTQRKKNSKIIVLRRFFIGFSRSFFSFSYFRRFFVCCGFQLFETSGLKMINKMLVHPNARKKNCQNFRINCSKFVEIFTAKHCLDAANSIYPTSEM